MGMLYDFLTSNEFRLQIEGIVEGFTQMQQDLESEKRAMQNIWNKREKQLQKVLLSRRDIAADRRLRAARRSGDPRRPRLANEREE